MSTIRITRVFMSKRSLLCVNQSRIQPLNPVDWQRWGPLSRSDVGDPCLIHPTEHQCMFWLRASLGIDLLLCTDVCGFGDCCFRFNRRTYFQCMSTRNDVNQNAFCLVYILTESPTH